MNKNELVAFDVENYKNYLLFMFKRLSDGKVLMFEQFNDSQLNIKSIRYILKKYTIVTFNGLKYDHLIVLAAMAGFTNANANKVSQYIIDNSAQPWQVRKQFGLNDLEYDHIDIIEVAPLSASLKIYAGRLHAPKMQDLPIHHSALITETDLPPMRSYCENDLDDTILLFNAMEGEIELRVSMSEQYKTDVRSKSDAQIAEAVIKHELQTHYEINPKRPKVKSGTQFHYQAPDNLVFETPVLQNLLNDFTSNPCTVGKAGHIELSELLKRPVLLNENNKSELLTNELEILMALEATEEEIIPIIKQAGIIDDKEIKSVLRRYKAVLKSGDMLTLPKHLNNRIVVINSIKYKIGIGGLHSMEESVCHTTENNKYILKDYDVASFYPSIILNNKLAPKHLGKPFLKIYKSIVDRRLQAKADGNKTVADSLKITINGSFGKFASKWSFLYSPDLMMQVTITGQLSLLMLIEMLELQGVPVVSANTDGIVVKMKPEQEDMVSTIVEDWEFNTDYVMEANNYQGLYSRDVNNYLAHKSDGSIKSKGAYANAGLRNNPVNEICKVAIREYISNNTSVEKTIKDCKDITQFITVRTVNGGALHDGCLVGKAIRWYYADDELDAIYYKTSSNKVPRSDGAMPLMELPKQFPLNIDYNWYITEANKMLDQIGLKGLHN